MSSPRQIPGFYYDQETNRYYAIPRSAAAAATSPVTRLIVKSKEAAQLKALDAFVARSILPLQKLDRSSGLFSTATRDKETTRKKSIYRGWSGNDSLVLASLRTRLPTPVILSHPSGKALFPTFVWNKLLMFIPAQDALMQIATVSWPSSTEAALWPLQIVDYPLSLRRVLYSGNRAVSMPELHRIGRSHRAPLWMLLVEYTDTQRCLHVLNLGPDGHLGLRQEPLHCSPLTDSSNSPNLFASSRDGEVAYVAFDDGMIHRFQAGANIARNLAAPIWQLKGRTSATCLACKESLNEAGKVTQTSLLMGTRNGTIAETIGDGEIEERYTLPPGQVASHIWHLPRSCGILVQTFHGKIFLFDERFLPSASLLFDPSSIDPSMKDMAFLHAVDVDAEILYSAARESGIVFAREIRQLGSVMAVWRLDSPIKTLLVQLHGPDGQDTLHVFID